jgi:hypothetical protein
MERTSREVAVPSGFCRLNSRRHFEFVQRLFMKSTLVMSLSVHELLLIVHRKLLMMSTKVEYQNI